MNVNAFEYLMRGKVLFSRCMISVLESVVYLYTICANEGIIMHSTNYSDNNTE